MGSLIAAFFLGAVISGALVWFFAPRPYVDDDLIVEAERIVCEIAPNSEYSDRMRRLKNRLH